MDTITRYIAIFTAGTFASIILTVLWVTALAYPCAYLWNESMPTLFGLKPTGYWPMLCALSLTYLVKTALIGASVDLKYRESSD
jgi:hypothetical protein